MSLTRFNDDPCRVKKRLQEATGTGRYMLNVPGNGDKPCFMDDPFIRMQKWGANLMTNSINLESDLMGLTRTANRDCITKNNYQEKAVRSQQVQYPSCLPTTDQTRATNPAWTARDLEQFQWAILPLNPQENTCFTFQNNLSTRILEKDYFVPTAPTLQSANQSYEYMNPYTTIPTLCTSENNCGKV